MGSQVTATQQEGSLEPLSCLRMGENPEIWKAVAMADHFEKIQKLPEPIPGCPNFRRVPGYKVYLCGQPTTEGFEKCLEGVRLHLPQGRQDHLVQPETGARGLCQWPASVRQALQQDRGVRGARQCHQGQAEGGRG